MGAVSAPAGKGFSDEEMTTMRGFMAFSVAVPLAVAMAACAVGGDSYEEPEVELESDAGTHDPDGSPADGGSGGKPSEDSGPKDEVDAGGDSGDGVDGDDAGADDDAGDADAGGADAGDADAGDDDAGDADAGDDDAGDADAGPDPTDPCAVDECYIGSTCIEAGQPSPADSCQVCLPTVARAAWSSDANSAACDGKPYWQGVTQALPTTPYGRKTAVSCHNCYVVGSSSADSLAKTLAMVNSGQGKVADLIELDIKEEGGVIYVEHDDGGKTTGALFSEAIADPTLKASSKILFIESKETTASESYARKVLETLQANGYAKAGRPVVLRAFDGVSANLTLMRKLLATAEFIAMRPHVRLHVLFSRGDGGNIATLHTRIQGVKDKGFHGVEFEYQTPNLYSALKYAESLDLGTNVWTIPASFGEVFVATLRDEVDAITVDYPVDKSRAIVADKNGVAYVNSWRQSGDAVSWHQQNGLGTFLLPLGAANRPTLTQLAAGESLFGGVLSFDPAQKQHLPLYDGDNDPSDGYLVSAVVTFDQPIPGKGNTSVLVGKADASGFSLELFKPNTVSDADAVLRFGVYVGGKYQYATYPANKLQKGPSYMVTGAYDGDGSVWIWVNNSHVDSTSVGPFLEGVAQNDSPIVVGADPQGAVDTQFYFAGQVQMALVQRWANH